MAALLSFALFFAFSRPALGASIDETSKQYEHTFAEVETWLAGGPALVPGDEVREKTLKKLDAAMLEPDAKRLPVVGAFFRSRMSAFLDDFEQTKVEDGVVVWKLYNHTEVIRTPETTFVVDLINGFDEVTWDEAALDRVIAGTDVLLITHKHADHADSKVARKFIAAGKAVYAPPEFWEDEDFAEGVKRVRDETFSIGGDRITVFPSFQKTDINNVYLLETTGGVRIMHTGDDNAVFQAGREWFKKIKPPLDVDLLIPNCWSPNLAVLLMHVKPKLMVASHEHELGHPVSGRRPYDFVYKVLSTVKVPFVVPAWGERMTLPQKAE